MNWNQSNNNLFLRRIFFRRILHYGSGFRGENYYKNVWIIMILYVWSIQNPTNSPTDNIRNRGRRWRNGVVPYLIDWTFGKYNNSVIWIWWMDLKYTFSIKIIHFEMIMWPVLWTKTWHHLKVFTNNWALLSFISLK